MCGTKTWVQLLSSGSFQTYFEVLVDFFKGSFELQVKVCRRRSRNKIVKIFEN